MAAISSDCLRAHIAHDRPFPVPDEVAGPELDDSAGSCIASVGSTGGTSERTPATNGWNHNSKCESIT